MSTHFPEPVRTRLFGDIEADQIDQGPDADVWAGAGKFWRQALAMGGVTFLLDDTT